MFPRQPIPFSEREIFTQRTGEPSSHPPMPREKLDEIKSVALLSYQPPYTVEEIKAMFPGLYFPIIH